MNSCFRTVYYILPNTRTEEKRMIKPDYSGGSIVNLMSTIYKACGATSISYDSAYALNRHNVQSATNIVLIVFDGLGFKYLSEFGQNSIFKKNLAGSLTSVFPSTTATAITTFSTGMAPLQHAVTGWFVYLKELGAVSAVLPFVPRTAVGQSFAERIDIQAVFQLKPAFLELQRKSYVFNQQSLIESPYSKLTTPNTTRIGYNGLQDFFDKMRSVIQSDSETKYIYGYWPEFDSICHAKGVNHIDTIEHFRNLNKNFSSFVDSLTGTNSIVIATADHGLIDTSAENVILVQDHPILQDCLVLPLCGEPRVAYCYVKPDKTTQFESYIQDNLSHCCDLYRSRQLLKENFFGLGEVNPKIYDRVGDYTIIMKNHYVIKDQLIGEKTFNQLGVHGGVSEWEMLVPLTVINRR